MAVTFKCPSCSTLLKTASPPPAGAALKCPRCGTAFRVPAASVPAAQPQPAPPPQPPAAPRPAAPVRPQPAPQPEPEEAFDLTGYEHRPGRRTPAPKKKGGACLWVFLAGAAVLLLGCGGTVAGLVALVCLAPRPASTGPVALAPEAADDARAGTVAARPTEPAKPVESATAPEKPRDDGGPKTKPPQPMPVEETGDPVNNDLNKVRDQAVAWIKENNRFGPTHKIVTDVGAGIDQRSAQRAGFVYTFSGDLLKSGKPTILAGWSGQFFVLEPTAEQAKGITIPKLFAVIKGTKTQDGLRRPAPRARLAELHIDNADKLDGDARITGTVACTPLEKGTAGCVLRFTCVVGDRLYTGSQPLAAIPDGDKPLSFSFPPLSSIGPTPAGPVVTFVELCTSAAPGKSAVLLSNTVAALVNALPGTGIVKFDDVIAMIKRLDEDFEVDEDAPGKPIVLVSLSGDKVADADLALLRGLKQLKTLNLGGAEKITDAGLAPLEALTTLTSLDLSDTAITDAGLVHLKPLSNLTNLELRGLKLKGDAFGQVAGLAKLESLTVPYENYTPKQLTPLTALKNLQQLNVNLVEDTDAKLAVLAELTKLKSLYLENTKLSNKGMPYIGVLTALESLTIVDDTPNGLSNAGMYHLKRLTGLRTLTLTLPHATDLGLESIAGLTGLQNLDLTGFPVTDRGMTYLASLRALETLRLPQAKITDAGLASVKGMTELHVLDLEGTGVTDAGLAHLAGLQKLEWLTLNKTKVNGTGLAQLKALANLHQLQLNDTNVGDTGAAGFEELKGLVTLELGNTPLTDAGLVHLKPLNKLYSFGLDGTKITDAGLVHLKGLPELGVLRLDGNPGITDAGLVHLKGMPKLGLVNVMKSRVTPKGVATLKEALPKLEVVADPN
jgi:Leucine-rich repeat (LRR) protein